MAIMVPDQQRLIADSWSLAAGSGYTDLLVPRFAPWTVDCIDEVRRLLPPTSPPPPGREDEEGSEMVGIESKSWSDGSKSPRRRRLRRCWVPCCGPGHELVPLSTALGDGWSVLGVDLAPGMVDEANRRLGAEELATGTNVVRAVVGNCATVPDPEKFPRLEDDANKDDDDDDDDRHFDLIFSIFGLQQMPDPSSVLRTWISALRPPGISGNPVDHGEDNGGGVAVICFWPTGEGQVETEEGPWARWADIFRRKLASSSRGSSSDGNDGGPENDNGRSSSSPPSSQEEECWSDGVVLARTAEGAGAEVLRNDLVSHEIVWDGGPEQLWEAMTMAGPWRAARLRRGDGFVDGLKEEYFSIYERGEPIVHRPRARLLVLRRR